MQSSRKRFQELTPHELNRRLRPRSVHNRMGLLVCLILALFVLPNLSAQMDQGRISGVITDSSGAVIPSAAVTLTSQQTGLILHDKSNQDGTYVFSPIKIGTYTVKVTAPGFKTVIQENIPVHVQSNVNLPITLQPGAVHQTITVTTAPPLLQTDSGAVSQVLTTRTINTMPLSGRNWVYAAQFTAGVAPANGSRGAGKGDFVANGQRPEQNDFILDGVDNNSTSVDFLSGASYVVRPPPDALAEFKVSTGDYSAEFGHSAGAVINASLKSGTNQVHGSAWEYVRNNAFDARDFNALTIPEYRENQFGATLGFPIIKNKLFFFGDSEANRIVDGQSGTYTVPTVKMRNGDFSELLNTGLTGAAKPIYLYQPNSGGAAPLTYNGQQNVFAPGQIDKVAQKILQAYPMPTETATTQNNYVTNLKDQDNTVQWDARIDWNISDKDQAFVRYSWSNEAIYYPAPLGPLLDGNGDRLGGNGRNLGENFALSETHLFTPNLVNEFRFGYNFGHFSQFQLNRDTNVGAIFGMGGLPFGPDYPDNGGLPGTGIGGISGFGSRNYRPSDEGENVYQILDNVTYTVGRQTLHMGVNLQALRFSFLQPIASHGNYNFNGTFTSNRGASFTGYGVADFLADAMNFASISNISRIRDARWYRAAYIQDDWKVTRHLALNLGLRYDWYEPYKEMSGRQANFYPTGPLGQGSGSAAFYIPNKGKSESIAPNFVNLLAANNIQLQYVSNERLASGQNLNFAPRVGISYTLGKTVIRSGFGVFYGGLANLGGAANLGQNYPFAFTDNFVSPSCTSSGCQSNGLTLESGFSGPLSAGLKNLAATPFLVGVDPHVKTPYTMNFNLSVERELTNNMEATISYVGALSRHLDGNIDPNSPEALVNPSQSVQPVRPFPGFGGTDVIHYAGVNNYNALQAKLNKRFSHGLSFLTTYTYSHSLDDVPETLGTGGDAGYRNTNLVPIGMAYANSPLDVRQRFTFTGLYVLPFGRGRAYLNKNRVLDQVVGGWQSSLTFQAQTGFPFTVFPNISTAAGGGARAILIRNPFAPGGTPPPSNPNVTCAAQTRTKTHWYNPCAFANPLPGSSIPVGTRISSLGTVLQYLGGNRNQISGPGFERVNMSLFKSFPILKKERLQLRVDAFNLFNTPAYGNPSIANNNSNGGLITGPQPLQVYTPDARFFQFSGKFTF